MASTEPTIPVDVDDDDPDADEDGDEPDTDDKDSDEDSDDEDYVPEGKNSEPASAVPRISWATNGTDYSQFTVHGGVSHCERKGAAVPAKTLGFSPRLQWLINKYSPSAPTENEAKSAVKEMIDIVTVIALKFAGEGKAPGNPKETGQVIVEYVSFCAFTATLDSDNDVEIWYRKLKEIFTEHAPEPTDADPGAVLRMKVLFTVLNTYGKHAAREGILDYKVWLSAERFRYKIKQSTQVYHLCYLGFQDIFFPVIDLDGKCHHEWIQRLFGFDRVRVGKIYQTLHHLFVPFPNDDAIYEDRQLIIG
jgi:hypothetical protein